MPHIHTAPNQHDHTASAYIIRLDTPEPTMFLHMHRKVNRLLQAGGHIELNETPWDSIQHELIEETGYNLNQLKILQPKTYRIKSLSRAVVHPVSAVNHTHRYTSDSDHYHTDSTYIFVAWGAPDNLPAEGEAMDIRWVTLDELRAFTLDEISSITQEIGEAVFSHFLEAWEPLELSEFISSDK
jgi:8-oxo-dGTP diphosphatase